MRIVIDTTKDKIVVPDSFFTQIDKMNQNIALGGGTELEYEDYIKKAFASAMATPLVRKSDI